MAEGYQYINDSGVIIADTDEVKSDVQTEWKDALGQDLILDDHTPQGQLIDAETLARTNVMRGCAQLANQINPNIAGGVWLDAICSWLDIYREPATHTLMAGCVLTGTANTLIPAGSRARTKNGDVAESLAAIRLSSSGTGTVDFQIVETGPVSVPAGSLAVIVDTILGWETVTNPEAGVLGQDRQSDASLRTVRNQRLANNSISTREAIVSAMYGVSGLQSMQFRENISSLTATIDGVTMKPHSIWVCVYGGESTAIAEALLRCKTDGAAWNGSTTVNVKDSASGQTYPVQFQRATPVPLKIRVTANEGSSSADLTSAIITAITDYAAGEIDGEPGFVVGEDISPFEISGAINIQQPGIFVRKVEIGSSSSDFSATVFAIAAGQIGTISEDNITVVRV